MTNRKHRPFGMLEISLYYTLIYSAASIYTYMPKYLQQGAQLTVEQNGIIQSIGPLVAIVTPFIWGQIADRAKSRNTVWAVILCGAAFTVMLVPISKHFVYIACVLACVSLFQTSFTPIADSVCSELCSKNKWDFGRTRKMASLGYAACTFLAGALLRIDRADIFFAYSIFILIALIPLLRLPKVPGHQSKRARMPIRKLFTNKPLVALFCFTFCVFLTTSYYYSFFLLYFTSPGVGGTTALFGICNALASIAEFPTMIYIDRVIRRVGFTRVFLVALVVLAIRWFLLGSVPDPVWLIILNMLHGISFACISYCAIVYINEYVQAEFKATGQAVNGIICFGVTKVIGSAGGGYLTGRFGFSFVFKTMGVFIAVVAVAYALMTPKIKMWTDAARKAA